MEKNWQEVRKEVKKFVEEEVYPAEPALQKRDEESKKIMSDLMQKAKDQSLWALGHPKDIGGEGMPFMEYVYINEVVGRSSSAMVALGTHSLQDSIMLREYASEKWRNKYLEPLVQGEIFPSFGMTEPDVSSSDPTQLETTAVLEGEEWVINGKKWFTSGAAGAAAPAAPLVNHFFPLITHSSPSNTAVVSNCVGSELETSGSVIPKLGKISPCTKGSRYLFLHFSEAYSLSMIES